MSVTKSWTKRSDYAEEYAGGAGHVPPLESSPRITDVSDPYGTAVRKMQRFEVREGDTYPTSNPRCQLNGGQNIEFNSTFFLGFRFGLPSIAEGGPDLISEWCNIWEFFGRPYEGSPTVQLGIHNFSGTNKLRWTRNAHYSFDEVFNKSYTADAWTNVVYKMKHSTEANGGFVELWINGEQVSLKGGNKLTMNVLETGVNDEKQGENIPQLYVYTHKFSPWHCYYDKFVLGTEKADVEYWTSEEGKEEKEQELKPDEDLATTGWTTTPLWSKINDASDATLVKATLA